MTPTIFAVFYFHKTQTISDLYYSHVAIPALTNAEPSALGESRQNGEKMKNVKIKRSKKCKVIDNSVNVDINIHLKKWVVTIPILVVIKLIVSLVIGNPLPMCYF